MDKEVGLKKASDYSDHGKMACEVSELHKYDRKLIRGLMRGFGTTMILWMISQERQHGYEIMSKLSEMYIDIESKKKMPSPSIIYPVLHELEQKGLISGEWDSHGKRKVKYYEITEEGKATLSRIKNIFRIHTHQLIDDFWADMFFRKQKEEE